MDSIHVFYSSEIAEHQSADAFQALCESPATSIITTACLGPFLPTQNNPNSTRLLSEIVPHLAYLRHLRVNLEERYYHGPQWDTWVPPELSLTGFNTKIPYQLLTVANTKQRSIEALLKRTPEVIALSLNRPLEDDWPCQHDAPDLPSLRRLELHHPWDEGALILFEIVVASCIRTLRSLFIPANMSNFPTLLSYAGPNQITNLVLDFTVSGHYNIPKDQMVGMSSEVIGTCPRLRNLALRSAGSGANLGRLLDAVQYPLASLDMLLSAGIPREKVPLPLVTAIQGANDEPHRALARLRVLAVNLQEAPDTALKIVCAKRRIRFIQYKAAWPLLWCFDQL